MAAKQEKKLHKQDLGSTRTAAVLGTLVVSQLSTKGTAFFYLDENDYIAFAPAEEFLLDAVPEPMAIQTLLDRGYDDNQLKTYLQGRDARLSRMGTTL